MLQKSPETERCDKAVVTPDDQILCVSCGHMITRSRWKTSISGHRHRFTNPLGLTFNILIFDLAPGVTARGSVTQDHTWFAGYGWQVVQCDTCHNHMGWFFSGGSRPVQFFGLIREQLNNLLDT